MTAPGRTNLLARCVALSAVVAASGCGSGSGSGSGDLEAWVTEVKARPGGRIEPLPAVRPAPVFVYEPGGRRSPFMPETPIAAVSADPEPQQRQAPSRPREFLEQFPLDALRMVGTLETQGESFGLVQTSDGLIHRVAVGHRLGLNEGRIVAITEAGIALVETVADGQGGELERHAELGLGE